MLNENLTYIDLIKKLQKKTENIRNIGKTSLVDSLISYNNIINPRVAGQIRIMDFRKDEQERCITMKSSSISIVFDSQKKKENYLINLIDSPGHVDFTSEVSSALKVCDGAIILIDVVEGICSQTESVLRQAWNEKIKCVLVLNKIDRLISEIQMDPMEAYIYLLNLLEKTNSLMGSLIVRDINVESENKQRYRKDGHKDSFSDNLERKNSEENIEIDMNTLIQEKENESYFSPDKGNVVFASAIDCWGFTLESFSEILTKTIGFKKEVITKLLWGDYYFNKTNKKVFKTPVSSNSKPMFVEFVLNNIYKLYKLALVDKNLEAITKAASTLNAELLKTEINMFDKYPRQALKSILRQWLKLPNSIFEMAVEFLPDPKRGALNKFNVLFPSHISPINSMIKKFKKFLKTSVDINTLENKTKIQLNGNQSQEYYSDLTQAPILAFISKMVPIHLKNIGEEIISLDKNQNEIKYMAFARAYCGSIKKGQEYFVIGPKHDTKTNYYDIKKYKFDNLYLFMGQSLEPVNEVPPGNIFSVSGLENYVFKTATISSDFDCPSIKPSLKDLNSIIKVCIVTEELKEMPILIDGLKKLNRSDPAVEYYVQPNGEHILVTSGEVHLERCVKDLEDNLARVKFKISAPMVNFKEGLANTSYQFKLKNIQVNEKSNNIEIVQEDEKKMDLNKKYILDEGESNIDLDNQKEILKSCTPMILAEKIKIKKPEVKNKVIDLKNKSKKTNFYIEKNLNSQVQINIASSKTNIKENDTNINKLDLRNHKCFAEDVTPNKQCKFTISTVGMKEEQLELLEKNTEILKEINKREFKLSHQHYEEFLDFKKKFLELFDDKKLKSLVEKYLYCFGPMGSGKNMLLIKHIKEKYCYFNKIKVEDIYEINDEELIEIREEENKDEIGAKPSINNLPSHIQDEYLSIQSENVSHKKEDVLSQSEKICFLSHSAKKEKSPKINEDKSTTIEEELSNLKISLTPKEFINAIKSVNGPLSEEEMYGVIFIIEEIKIQKSKGNKIIESDNSDKVGKNEEKKFTMEDNVINHHETNIFSNNVNRKENLSSKEDANNSNLLNKLEEDLKIKNELELEIENKNMNLDSQTDDNLSLNSKQMNIYGPIIGQITGTIKDCCRKAFLNSEPRLYEALYLCLFQIRQENIGNIHSVINKRRGKGMICTIEAQVPIVESFGFVEEIRKKSSGMANPMLQFHKWEMIDIDPFYAPTTQEEIENFGVNIDTPNIAKNYINKVRLRKGLPIDEKLVKHSDKQKNLSKKK